MAEVAATARNDLNEFRVRDVKERASKQSEWDWSREGVLERRVRETQLSMGSRSKEVGDAVKQRLHGTLSSKSA